ncbi:MAG: gamma-glutamyl-gamma-aminobutyrate hydrolase family protein [Acidimicrobiales bacterium]
MVAPRILIPGRVLPAGRAGRQAVLSLGQRYVNAIIRSGGVEMVCLPRTGADLADAALDALLRQAQGLCLPGGGDLDPARYGQNAHPRTYGVEHAQDEFELALLAAALRVGVPVLAICRGLQLVNVFFGGSLDQHLQDQPGRAAHAPATFPQAEPDSIGPLLEVAITPGSKLARLLAGPAADTDVAVAMGAHSHHQAVDRLGADLVVVGRSADGVVEALEHPRHWLVAVQWHPEDTFERDPAMRHLFAGFLHQARQQQG